MNHGAFRLLVTLTSTARTARERITVRRIEDVWSRGEFLWGSATAAYQCEGAWKEGGKGETEWDYFNHKSPLNINDVDGDVASDFYHRYEEDIDLLARGGQNTFRFSISWARIMPNGTGEINREGIDFYNGVIDYCLERGMEPAVTLFHYDLPLAIARKGGWLNEDVTDLFCEYAKTCFDAFGDRVVLWSTINEPRYYAYCSNIVGNYPPNRRLDFQGYFQTQYNLMLASAKAVAAYHEMGLGGSIGVVHDSGNVEIDPLTQKPSEVFDLADFFYGRTILCPALLGGLPENYDEYVGRFGATVYHAADDARIFAKGKVDYLGLNLYNRQYVTDWNGADPTEVFHNNRGAGSANKEGIRIAGAFESSFDAEVRRNMWGREENPRVMYTALCEIAQRYGNPLILITENGCGAYETPDEDGVVDDGHRIALTGEFLDYMLKARGEGVDVRGYYHWSSMDLYSWINGYEKRYGLIRVDFEDGLRRVPKKSYFWYRDYIAQHKDL